MLSAEFQNIFFINRRAKFRDDIGFGNFTANRVFDADDACVFDARMLRQHVFDFFRIHVFAADNNHIFLPVSDKHKAVVIHVTEVAGQEPALARIGQNQFPMFF